MTSVNLVENNFNHYSANPQLNRNQNASKNNITDSIETSVNDIIDKIGDKGTNKSTRTAIVSSSIAVVVIGLVTLLNPRYSQKFANKLNDWRLAIKNKSKKSQDDFLKSKFYKFSEKSVNWMNKTMEFSCNFNSIKDIVFKKMSTQKVKSKQSDNIFKKIGNSIRNGFVAIGKKPHEIFTKFGDSLAKMTVKNSCKKALKKCENLENLIKEYSINLSPAEKKEIERELHKIQELKQYYSVENIDKRLVSQEKLMDGLEEKTWNKFKDYCRGFKIQNKGMSDHITDNLSFWAQEILKPDSDKVQKEGMEQVNKFVRCGNGENGAFDRIIEIFRNSQNISQEEKRSLEKSLNKFSKSITNAHNRECIDYFGKKKDLILGSAPTDVISALFFSTLAGISIINSDDKEERISKTMTKVMPIMLGVCANISMTALLYSGVKGLIAALGTSITTSKIGSFVDEKILGHKHLTKEERKLAKLKAKAEVKHA